MNPSHPADRALLARAASGDVEAFGAIYERYQHAVFRFACAMTGSRDAAADITHDAFLAVLADASRFDPNRASLSTYLYGVVRNLCRERLRRASRLQAMDTGLCDRPDGRGASRSTRSPTRSLRGWSGAPLPSCRRATESSFCCATSTTCRMPTRPRSSARRCRRCARASIGGVSSSGRCCRRGWSRHCRCSGPNGVPYDHHPTDLRPRFVSSGVGGVPAARRGAHGPAGAGGPRPRSRRRRTRLPGQWARRHRYRPRGGPGRRASPRFSWRRWLQAQGSSGRPAAMTPRWSSASRRLGRGPGHRTRRL